LIQALRVRDLATIDELELAPGPGLNVLTGETGAGKSVLLGAIALLAGRRVSKELVRSGAQEASVEAILADADLLARARELGLAGEDDAELLVARSISAEGRGRVQINGRLATSALLAELLGDVLEVVSQGEHLALLRPEVQLELLDRHGGLEPRASEVAALYRDWRERALELERRRAQAAELARREDQLRFEIEQIDRVAPRADELEALESEHRRLAHVERLGRDVERALEALDGSGGAREGLAQAAAALGGARALDPALGPAAQALERAALEADDALRELERYRASLEAEPDRLEQVEARLGELRRLQSRYGPSAEAILEHRRRAQEEYERVAGGERRTAQLESELAVCAERLEAAARALSAARAQVSAELAASVTAELAAVDLAKARFGVELEPVAGKTPEGREAPSGPGGRESAVFQLTANPGEKPRRLRDAASGGELARLLLALRNVLRGAERSRVLLFDEVDAGIGGRAAGRVGERLRSLGRHHQVLCITHLPQVAALGDRHFRISKRVSRGRTRSAIEELQGELRVDEVARMASGSQVTEASRAHARELLSRA
jgi:DNA repair protein RecN (Recombination protein N)